MQGNSQELEVQTSTDPRRMATKIGVMGGASDITLADHMQRSHLLGEAVAASGSILITGACPGLPLAAACGAKQSGGLVIGISPAINLAELVDKYQSPVELHDVLVFTGSGLMGREVINIRTSDIVVIVGGRSGTLGELAIAYDEGKLIGVLTATGGISDMVAEILAACKKDTGSQVLYDSDPRKLVDNLLRAYRAPPTSAAPIVAGVDRPATVKDPVCGMRLIKQAAVAERLQDGVQHFFCSQACVQRFDAEPSRYAPSPEPNHG